MDAAGESFRWAAGFVLGALSAIVIEFVRGQLERHQRRQDRRDDFQRETLLALKEAVFTHARLAAEMHSLVLANVPMKHELAEKGRLAALEVDKLAVRVLDHETRDLVKKFQAAAEQTSVAGQSADRLQLRVGLIQTLTLANDRIGTRLRSL